MTMTGHTRLRALIATWYASKCRESFYPSFTTLTPRTDASAGIHSVRDVAIGSLGAISPPRR
jgi:hypothetical protein